jgi:hypothetical protein
MLPISHGQKIETAEGVDHLASLLAEIPKWDGPGRKADFVSPSLMQSDIWRPVAA